MWAARWRWRLAPAPSIQSYRDHLGLEPAKSFHEVPHVLSNPKAKILVSGNRASGNSVMQAELGIAIRFKLINVAPFLLVKFIYSEKATKFCEISTVDLTVTNLL